MTDKQFNILSISAIALILVWLFKERQDLATVAPSDSPALPVSWTDPMDAAFGGSTPTSGPFAPPTAPALSINIANQSANLLSQNMIPLFGFVGVAQGEMWQ